MWRTFLVVSALVFGCSNQPASEALVSTPPAIATPIVPTSVELSGFTIEMPGMTDIARSAANTHYAGSARVVLGGDAEALFWWYRAADLDNGSVTSATTDGFETLLVCDHRTLEIRSSLVRTDHDRMVKSVHCMAWPTSMDSTLEIVDLPARGFEIIESGAELGRYPAVWYHPRDQDVIVMVDVIPDMGRTPVFDVAEEAKRGLTIPITRLGNGGPLDDVTFSIVHETDGTVSGYGSAKRCEKLGAYASATILGDTPESARAGLAAFKAAPCLDELR